MTNDGATSVAAELVVSARDGVVTATFNRPRARNALTYAMYDGLAALCQEIDADRTTKVLVLTGAGDQAFAAGTDIAQFRMLQTEADSLAYEARIETVLSALERCRVPTIAAMAGACTGGGAMIAACCDLRIAASNVRFGFPIARTLGNCLSAQNLARLSALLGDARVKQMIFTAQLIDAEAARASGLVSTIVPATADLAAAVAELAQTVAANAPLTLRATKVAMLRQRRPVAAADDLVLSCYLSADFRHAVEAFATKQMVRWSGT